MTLFTGKRGLALSPFGSTQWVYHLCLLPWFRSSGTMDPNTMSTPRQLPPCSLSFSLSPSFSLATSAPSGGGLISIDSYALSLPLRVPPLGVFAWPVMSMINAFLYWLIAGARTRQLRYQCFFLQVTAGLLFCCEHSLIFCKTLVNDYGFFKCVLDYSRFCVFLPISECKF